ncbi:MAG: ABC transporter permease [candidate division Zixibacteria bacterium]|nr:ABC transporter permease [candidate division Zixibacteria bacterium]
MNGTLTVFFKEIKDILRDRRTIISMVIVPLLFYPLLTMGLGSVIASQIEKTRAERQPVMLLPAGAAPSMRASLAADTSVRIVSADSIHALLLAEARIDTTLKSETIDRIFAGDPTRIPREEKAHIYYKAISKKWIQAVVEVPPDVPVSGTGNDSLVLAVFIDGADIKSDAAGDHIKEWGRALNDSLIERRLAAFGTNRRTLQPFWVASQDVAPKSKQAGRFMAMMLPYMLMILTMTGGMYPAMDITAGEKERNTLETLLAAPVARWHLALGKFLTVLTAGFVTMLLSMTSMTVSMKWGMAQMAEEGGGISFSMSAATLGWILFLMIPMAILFASLLVVLSISARSYKEAQSYATPLLMVVIMPAMISFVPGIELNWALTFVPVVNLCLALKEVILGIAKPAQLFAVFGTTTLYAAFMLFVTTRIFERESVLFRT